MLFKRSIHAAAVGALLIASAVSANAGITSTQWGSTADGTPVHLYTLTNNHGMVVKISNYGGIVVSLRVPSLDGPTDVALGLKSVAEYAKESPYFGALIGRFGNRIAHGKFHLNGKTYTLPLNNFPAGIACSLHGGKIGFDKKVWDATPGGSKDAPALILKYVSPDGEEGYPGKLTVQVIYRLLPSNTLRLEYTATTTKPTPINLTNHLYFNLAGEGNGTVLNQYVQIFAHKYTPTNKGQIPFGKIVSVRGTPFDFLRPHTIGSRINERNQQLKWAGGYDHNWVLDHPKGEFALAANAYDLKTGIHLACWTDQPGLQFYTGNFLDGTIVGRHGKKYLHRGAFTMETQHYPDAPNHPNFPTTILKPGQVFHSATEYRFTVKK